MARRFDIDRILQDWPYRQGEVVARQVKAADGRQVLQMRVDMGLLQLEVEGRPDGQRPGGAETYLEFLVALSIHEGDDFQLTPEHCGEADREFFQFYHRRICWLALRKFREAARDADHSLALMDFVRNRSASEEWVMAHEQYRPFVMFHRVQAGALAELEEHGPEAAIEEINRGLDRFRKLFAQYDALDQFDSDELVARLIELKESMRTHYHVGRTLPEQLADAVAAEQYELAAKLRDQLAQRPNSGD